MGVPRRRVDDDALKRLWPSDKTDKELAEYLGHHRSTIRSAADRLGLPPRRFARQKQEFPSGERR